MIPTAIVGYGIAARVFHVPVIRSVPGLHLAAVVQRRGDPPAGLRVFRDIQEMLDSGTIRLAVIATPNPSHYELARRCLEAGLDVVVDKPFTTTYEEADELAELAAARKRILTVHHNRRWDADFLTVQKLIASRALGRVVMLESNYDRFRPARREGAWRERDEPGSGILFDLGSHLIDQALTLFGQPERITADIRGERNDAVVDDAFDLTLHYPRLRVDLRASMLAASPRARFRIHGTSAAFEKHGMDPQEDRLKAGLDPWVREDESNWGIVTTADHRWRVPSEPGDYRKFYQNVRDAIEGTADLIVTARQAAEVVRVLTSAKRLVAP